MYNFKFRERQSSKLKCSHVMCEKCARDWLSKAKSSFNATCPICRQQYTKNDINHVTLNC